MVFKLNCVEILAAIQKNLYRRTMERTNTHATARTHTQTIRSFVG